MNIWGWVTDVQDELYARGNDRLADLIDEVPQASANMQHDRLDALVPEALHLAREAGSPWLEVFFRHWNLQSLVFMRNRVVDALPEAVALVDFSHSEETRDCPQSVCTVQDLTECYGQADGPGYVPERLAIADETLARIDATWNCWTCISGEKAIAIMDDGRYEDAWQFLEEQVRALRQAGYPDRRHSLRRERVEALLRLGRYDEAQKLHDKTPARWGDDHDELWMRLDGARIKAYLGKHKQAATDMPAFSEIQPSATFYLRWAELARLLAQHDAIRNDATLDGQLAALSDHLSELGANYDAAVIALWRAELAVWRNDPTAPALCSRVDTLAAKLRRPEAIAQNLAALRDWLAGHGKDSGASA